MKSKLRALLIVTFLAGLLAALFLPNPLKDQFNHFMPTLLAILLGWSLTLSLSIRLLAARLKRTDVTSAEKWARRMLFEEAPPNVSNISGLPRH
jgi:hypothetical protein